MSMYVAIMVDIQAAIAVREMMKMGSFHVTLGTKNESCDCLLGGYLSLLGLSR